MKKYFLVLIMTMMLSCQVLAKDDFAWQNDLRTKFLNNESIILVINIRSFNSEDTNGDGFIQEEFGEHKGTFLNAIERLDELKSLGVNTIHILPITPTGKVRALGSAGSLYALSDFNSLNPDLYDKNSDLTLEQQAQKFILECHRRNIRVIADIPACGSYDLFFKSPELFVKNQFGEMVVPADWYDVGLLDTNNEKVLESYKSFVDFMQSLGVDGIRADVAHSKNQNFWHELITYSRANDKEFMWLAEVSQNWSEPISKYGVFTPYDKLLEAGFDGFYGSFMELKSKEKSKDFYNMITSSIENLPEQKAVIGAFTTHDEVSPILLKGEKLSEMMIWLNATLPVNSYFVDGFQVGDDYYYENANQKALNSNTDSDIYFTHNGQIDIFNFSRKPDGKHLNIKNEFIIANDVKQRFLPIINNGIFTPVKIKNDKVFAYSFKCNDKQILTIGNLDFKNKQNANFVIPNYSKDLNILPIKISTMPKINSGKISLNLTAGEIVVLFFTN